MCPCIVYLYFCKETWLSVNRVVFWRGLFYFPHWTNNTFEACTWWEHLWIIFPIFKRQSNIGTIGICFRIMVFRDEMEGPLEIIGPDFFHFFEWQSLARQSELKVTLLVSRRAGTAAQASLTSGLFPSPSITFFQTISICVSMYFSTTSMPSESQRRVDFYIKL